jgi:branched-chain amino acid transport system substrate-binding protein
MLGFGKNNVSKIMVLLIVAVLLIGTIAGCGGGTTSTSAKSIKVGVITSMSGDLSAAFKAMADAVKPCQDLYNKSGITIDGQKYLFDITAYDDQSTAAGAVTATNKAVEDGSKFIIAPVYPVALRAVVPIADEAKVLAYSATQIDPSTFEKKYNYAFNNCATMFFMGSTHSYLTKTYPNVKKVAFIGPSDPGVDYIITLAKADWAKKGIQVTVDQKFTPDTQDFYPVLTKVLATNPDALEIPGGMPFWVAGTINAARDQGFKGPIFGTATPGGLRDIAALVKPGYADGFFCGAPDVEGTNMPQEVQDLNKLITEQLKHPINFDNFQVIAGLSVTVQAIQKANSIDVNKVKATMEEKGFRFNSPMGGTGKFIDYLEFHHLGVMDKSPVGFIKGTAFSTEWVENPLFNQY